MLCLERGDEIIAGVNHVIHFIADISQLHLVETGSRRSWLYIAY